MKYPLVAFSVALLASLAPLAVSAQVVTTHTAYPSNCSVYYPCRAGVQIYNFPDQQGSPYADETGTANNGTPGIGSDAAYTSAIVQDLQAHWNPVAPYTSAPTSYGVPGIWEGDHADSDNYTTNADLTLDRICYDIDSASGPSPDAVHTYSTGDDYASSDNNYVILYNGSAWWEEKAKGSSNEHTAGLACTSYALPGQTLSASTYSIHAGDPVTLTWDDTNARDYRNGSVWNPDAASVVGAPIPPAAGAFPGPNGRPNAVCTSTNWSNQGLTGGGWVVEGRSHLCEPDGGCEDRPYYDWQADNTTTGEVKSGSVTLNPGPTQTTTYTYSCTNANGTTVVKATVTVSNPATSLPDLIAGSVSPTSGTAGVPVALSSLISNTGPIATSKGFPNLFEISSTSNPASFAALDAKVAASPASSALGNATSTTASNTATASYTFPTPGTWYVRACADTDSTNNTDTALSSDGVNHIGAIAESNEGDNCGPTGQSGWTPITINPNQPNLQASDINVSSADTATDLSFFATITNIGAGSTNTGFTNLFEVESDADYNGDPVNHNTVTAYRTGPSATLAGGASAVSTAASTYRFPSAGTWHIRACADESTPEGPGTITESDEGDNCGDWTSVSVTAPSPPSNCMLKANPAVVASGGQTTLTWSSTGATSCTGTGFSTGGATNNQIGVPVTPTTNPTNYSITCNNSAGQCTWPVSVIVNPPMCTAVPVTLTASPTRVKQGDKATLTYTIPQVASGVTQCTITAPGYSFPIPTSSCVVTGGATGSTQSNTITTQTTFTLTCGSAVTTATVDVLPAIIED